jgi:hypothetical protein
MEERLKSLMVVPSFQMEFDFDALLVSKTDDEWIGGTTSRGGYEGHQGRGGVGR